MLILFHQVAGAVAGPRETLEFSCPKAYQGIKSEMLPTYWEPTDSGHGIGAGQSHVQGQYLICIYRKVDGTRVGNVRRLIPSGYQCETGGKGKFQCIVK